VGPEPVWTVWRKENCPTPTGIQPPDRPARRLYVNTFFFSDESSTDAKFGIRTQPSFFSSCSQNVPALLVARGICFHDYAICHTCMGLQSEVPVCLTS
jgi:hypothetical protein